ncbi:hypothetical protein MTR67_020095 [Solanum verrucosum]|uniref:Uncharacterized protein n=1 Tax=Solanum verrucosum TaxID=315347 RepID=A0AAF0TUJ3_SOLVR|nr:hypothetical protein MTR67_020095 [Solanum verrucosum]
MSKFEKRYRDSGLSTGASLIPHGVRVSYGFKYHATFLASFLGGAIQVGVAELAGFMIYKFLPEIGKKEGELPEAKIWKMHWFWKKVLPK